MLRDRAVVVTGGETAVGRELVDGLRDRGARAVGAPARLTSREHARAELDAALDAVAGSQLDALVHVPADREALSASPLVALDEAAWDARGEAVLRSALYACQAAHARMAERGGRIVLVCSTAGLVGGADRAAFAMATEGMRSLAKVAARQWGAAGITVNCVAVAVDDARVGPLAPALGRAIDVRRDVASVVASLVGEAGGAITGVTIPVDGGVVMTP
jgi:NAD(P)-dependent dehydrogenase (short-subunit alcohol dehydrogenase family)